MIDRINFQAQNKISPLTNTTTSQTQTQQTDYAQSKGVSSEASCAAMAYASPQINRVQPRSLEDYIDELKQQGKAEGRDYKISTASKYDNHNLYIYDKEGNELKTYYWCNGSSKEDFSGFDENFYTNNRLTKTISRTNDNKVFYYENYFHNDEIPQSSFTKEGITSKTTPKEYEEYLKQNDKNYKIEHTDDNCVFIDEFDDKNRRTQCTFWMYGDEPVGSELVSPDRSVYNDKGQEFKRIIFDKDKTSVCNYVNVSGEKILPS